MAAVLDIATKDLDDEYDFNNMTLIQKDALVDKIFNRQREFGKDISCEIIKRLFFFVFNRVQHHHKDEIIFNMKGKMSCQDIQDVILSFF